MATRRVDAPGPPTPLTAALADLERLAARPELAAAAHTLGRLLRAAFESRGPDPGPHTEPDVILAAWGAGVPAFRAGETPPRADVADRIVAVCAAFEGENPAATALAAAVQTRKVDPVAWADEAIAGGHETIDAESMRHALDPAFVRSVLRLALIPALAPHAARLDALRPEGVWAGEGCPNCGNPPSLAESRGLDQRRFLRCGVCAGDWPGDRLRCPFCGETDHRRLGYAFVDGEGDRHRLASCDSCGARLKVVSTLRPLSAPGLIVAELATAHLDALADVGPEDATS